jgi:phosphomethylpyrimidine synthase
VRAYAADKGLSEEDALADGMAEKAREFKDGGAKIYR